MLLAAPPADLSEKLDRLKREVTVVIDRSGSMAGEKLEQVRTAATQVLEGLADGETFNIIVYNETMRQESLFYDRQRANRHLREARQAAQETGVQFLGPAEFAPPHDARFFFGRFRDMVERHRSGERVSGAQIASDASTSG